jgi:hypothetical protein
MDCDLLVAHQTLAKQTEKEIAFFLTPSCRLRLNRKHSET